MGLVEPGMTVAVDEVRAAASAAGLLPGAYSVLEPRSAAAAHADACLTPRFPSVSWGRVDWDAMPNLFRHEWTTPESASALINALAAREPLGDADVYVIGSNALRPILRMPVGALRANLAPLLELDWDTWIVDVGGTWCMEVYHEGEFCFGFHASTKAGRAHQP